MTLLQLQKFILYLQKQAYHIFGPKKVDDKLLFQEIRAPAELVLNGETCFYPPKKFFLPESELLFDYQKNQLNEARGERRQQAIFGLTPYDLKGVLLYHQVFEKDFYFQERIKNTLIVGQSAMPCDSKSFCFWEQDFEEDILEHLKFDIYLGVTDGHGLQADSHPSTRLSAGRSRIKRFKVYSGSEDGQKILDKFGYKGYEHVDYAGAIKEQGPDKRMHKIKEAMEKSGSEIWEELGKRCLACGKCALVCPMCFCFDVTDRPDFTSGEGRRVREWTTCFYSEFSQIGGGYQFLTTIARRILFWYEHKFVRMPEEYGFMGCTGCGRCSKVCPVGIDIQENLERVLKV